MPRRIPHNHIKPFDETNLPDTIYFDSSFIVKTLVDGMEYHQECVDFVKKLEIKQPIVVVSKLSRLELWCAAIRIGIYNLFKKKNKPVPNTDEVLYDYPDLVKRFHPQAVQLQKDFDNLLQRFVHRIKEDINDEILEKAHVLMLKYNLGSYDATHIATMEYWKMKDIVAFDHCIEDIVDLNVWTFGGCTRHKARWYKRSKLPTI